MPFLCPRFYAAMERTRVRGDLVPASVAIRRQQPARHSAYLASRPRRNVSCFQYGLIMPYIHGSHTSSTAYVQKQTRNEIEKTEALRDQSSQSLSSGKRLRDEAQDPQASAEVKRIRHHQEQQVRYDQNIQRCVQTAEMSDQRLRSFYENYTEAINVYSKLSGIRESDVSSYVKELDAKINIAADTLMAKDINGHNLFGAGQLTGDAFSVTRNADGSVQDFTYNGSGEGIRSAISDSETDFNPYTRNSENQILEQSVKDLIALRDQLKAYNPSNPTTPIDAAKDAALTQSDAVLGISTQQTERIATLKYTQLTNETQFKSNTLSASELEDAPFLETYQDFLKHSMTLQVSSKVLSILNDNQVLRLIH